MGCIACGRGFHSECRKCTKNKCHKKARIQKLVSIVGIQPEGRGAPTKDPDSVKDRHSTGRKRAAQLYPIFENKSCEWRGKRNCGGGLHPIVGCIAGKQEARHHGPVKDTLRNEPGNVHRICTLCHNRWHAKNNDVYDEEVYDKLKHNPEPATAAELADSELYWAMKK